MMANEASTGYNPAEAEEPRMTYSEWVHAASGLSEPGQSGNG
jgi:hypothetical protein